MTQVLVVDDDAQIRSVIRQALETDGYRVVEASNGETALQAVRREAPDLLVTNIFMPERDGLELIREVRRASATLPIIAVSGGMQHRRILPEVDAPEALAPAGVLQIARVFGASHVLSKPFRLAALRDAARVLLDATQTP